MPNNSLDVDRIVNELAERQKENNITHRDKFRFATPQELSKAMAYPPCENFAKRDIGRNPVEDILHAGLFAQKEIREDESL